MLALYVWLKNWFNSEEGQDLIEYAVLIAFIALVVWLAVTNAGKQISDVWVNISTKLAALPS